MFNFSAVNQIYDTYVHPSHVIRGNDAILKCDIPSFVTDLVQVVNWLDDNGSILSHGT